MSATKTDKTAKHAYEEALSRFNELKLEEKSIQEQIQYLQNEVSAARRVNHLDEAALKLLAGEDYQASEIQGLMSKLEDLKQHQALIKRALSLSYDQLQNRLSEASKQACKEAEAEHQTAVQEIIKAVVYLAKANQKERAIRKAIEDQGFMNHFLRPMCMPKIGYLNDSQSFVNLYLMEAVQYGFLNESEINNLKGS